MYIYVSVCVHKKRYKPKFNNVGNEDFIHDDTRTTEHPRCEHFVAQRICHCAIALCVCVGGYVRVCGGSGVSEGVVV